MLKVLRPFSTTTRRLEPGLSVSSADLVGDTVPLKKRLDRGDLETPKLEKPAGTTATKKPIGGQKPVSAQAGEAEI